MDDSSLAAISIKLALFLKYANIAVTINDMKPIIKDKMDIIIQSNFTINFSLTG